MTNYLWTSSISLTPNFTVVPGYISRPFYEKVALLIYLRIFLDTAGTYILTRGNQAEWILLSLPVTDRSDISKPPYLPLQVFFLFSFRFSYPPKFLGQIFFAIFHNKSKIRSQKWLDNAHYSGKDNEYSRQQSDQLSKMSPERKTWPHRLKPNEIITNTLTW